MGLQNIARLDGEITAKRTKANELDQKVAVLVAKNEKATRELEDDALTSNAETLKFQQDIRTLEESCQQIHAEADSEQRNATKYNGEATNMRVQLRLLQRDLEKAKELLAEKKRATSLKREALHVRSAERNSSLGLAEAELREVIRETEGASSHAARLETELAMERECCGGLRTALAHTLGRG